MHVKEKTTFFLVQDVNIHNMEELDLLTEISTYTRFI